jgi:hypothetical protein
MILCVRSEFRLQLGAVQGSLPWVHLSGAQFIDSVAVLACRNPRVGHRDYKWNANMNTLAQAEARRNRLKNNTTRHSPAPDQAIRNCWQKRTLAGYPTVLLNRESRVADRKALANFAAPKWSGKYQSPFRLGCRRENRMCNWKYVLFIGRFHVCATLHC